MTGRRERDRPAAEFRDRAGRRLRLPQLALGALGVTLIFGILRFANFAHGDVMAFGTMVVLQTTWWFQGMGVGIAPLPDGAHRLALRNRGRGRLQPGCGPRRLPLLPAAQEPAGDPADRLGRRDVRAAGHRPLHHRPRRPAPSPTARASSSRPPNSRPRPGLKEVPQRSKLSQGLTLARHRRWPWPRSSGSCTGRGAGKAMRAYSDNEDLALLSRCQPGSGGVLRVADRRHPGCGWLAPCTAIDKSYKPFTYFQLLLPIFASAILGGIGHPIGAGRRRLHRGAFRDLGDLRLQEVPALPGARELGAERASCEGGLLSTDYKLAISFVILVVVLLVRPTGIFRGRVLS